MNFDLKLISDLLQALGLATLPVIAWFIASYLKKQGDILVISLDEKTRDNLKWIVRSVVFAAEQMYGAGNGAEKKAYAIKIVQDWSDGLGLNLDIAVIEAAIEEAVLENFPKFPEF